jgi:hypothetical protein
MRSIVYSTVWLAVGAVMLSTPGAWGRQHAADPPSASVETTAPPAAQTSEQGQATPSAPQQDSLAEAARKARAQQRKESGVPKVFTNDNIPTSGGISTVGNAGAAAATGDTGAVTTTAKGTGSGNDEKTWRDRFTKLHAKLDQDKADVDVMQRELGVLSVQYYNDPVKALQQNLTRDDINKKTAAIDAKKQAVVDDQKAIDDAEDDLRKAGGDAGWSR